MEHLFHVDELMMMGLVIFSSFWIFLFNYRQDNKDKYAGARSLIVLDLFINMGMSVTGYLLVSVVFKNVPEYVNYILLLITYLISILLIVNVHRFVILNEIILAVIP